MIETLRTLVNQVISDENEDFDLKDRAIFYCKALQYDLVDLKKAFDDKKNLEDMFIEEEQIKRVYFQKTCMIFKEGATLEFNTLSVIFRKPANKFIKSLADLNLMK
jgi:AP-4 complex subunit beta-1